MRQHFEISIGDRRRKRRAWFLLALWVGFLFTAMVFPCDEVIASTKPVHESVAAPALAAGHSARERAALGHPAPSHDHCSDGIDLSRDVPKTVSGGASVASSFFASFTAVIPNVPFLGELPVAVLEEPVRSVPTPWFTAQAAQHLYLLTTLRLRD